MASKKISLSIYLLKPNALAAVEKIFEEGTPLIQGLEGRFVGLPARPQEPGWFGAVKQFIERPDRYVIIGQAPAGMMLIRRGANSFVVTFGHAWQRLEPSWLEPDFGRRVALNSVPPNQVLEVNSEQVFAKWHLARERSPRATSVTEFGLEFDRDLVAALEGVPSEEIFGGVVRGSTSLRMNIPVDALGAALDRAAELFASDAYKKRWPEIDNLSPVTEPILVDQLDAHLDKDLQSGKAKKSAVLFTPSFRRGDVAYADSYVFGRRTRSNPIAPYLLYGSWENHLACKGERPSLANARRTPVHLLDDSGELLETRSVYECLGYEVSKDGAQYVLSSGIWYRATTEFVKSIDRVIARLQLPDVVLPAWDGRKSEGEYNESCCARGSGMLYFDARVIPFGGGQSKFEFCDFMHPSKKILFFAKIASRSSDCSHLVEQVRRTVELLFSADGTFRRKLKKAMEKHYPSAKRDWLDERPLPGEWNLCLVSLGREKTTFPLFAKCGIARLVRMLDQACHRVSFVCV